MARQKNDTPETVSDARLAWLRGQLMALGADVARAIEAESHTATVSIRREQRHLRNELDTEMARRAAEAAAAQSRQPTDYTPEEWASHVRADAAAATDADLEIYVYEWMERSGLRLVVESGEPHLRRVS